MHVAICHESLARSFVHSFARSLALLATLVRSLALSLARGSVAKVRTSLTRRRKKTDSSHRVRWMDSRAAATAADCPWPGLDTLSYLRRAPVPCQSPFEFTFCTSRL